jgi:hypothetical protein
MRQGQGGSSFALKEPQQDGDGTYSRNKTLQESTGKMFRRSEDLNSYPLDPDSLTNLAMKNPSVPDIPGNSSTMYPSAEHKARALSEGM